MTEKYKASVVATKREREDAKDDLEPYILRSLLGEFAQVVKLDTPYVFKVTSEERWWGWQANPTPGETTDVIEYTLRANEAKTSTVTIPMHPFTDIERRIMACLYARGKGGYSGVESITFVLYPDYTIEEISNSSDTLVRLGLVEYDADKDLYALTTKGHDMLWEVMK